jgi:aryl-alcohol dehydrogenase-like predicted oxidoreductase
MEYRALGRTGQRVSVIGVGGSHLSGEKVTPKQAIEIVRGALDAGINFLDNSWDYGEGESEKRVGKALKDGYRDSAFVMTKIDGRNRKEAEKQLNESLKRLGVETIDLVQHHEVIRYDDVTRIMDDDGAQRALEDARDAGKLRFIGFTGHKDPSIHVYMMTVAREHGVHFDTVQMPLNVMDAHYRSFEKQAMPMAVREGIAVLGMKSMGNGVILKSGAVTPEECLRYALHLPTSVVITGIDSMELLEQAIRVGSMQRPMTRGEAGELVARTAEFAASGMFELFKTTSIFDATAQHPDWLGENPAWVKEAMA